MLFNKQIATLTIVFYWTSLCTKGDGKFTKLSRAKRTLLWERGRSYLQIITGVGTPLDLDVETVIIAAIIKGIYVLPQNVSDLKPFGNVYYERKKRSLSRWDIYDFLAQIWQIRGFGGKPCLLRTICELSHKPVDKTYGLFDEIMHAVFKPTTTKEAARYHSDNEYYAAEKFGRKSGKSCGEKFSDCSVNLVDMFTI